MPARDHTDDHGVDRHRRDRLERTDDPGITESSADLYVSLGLEGQTPR